MDILTLQKIFKRVDIKCVIINNEPFLNITTKSINNRPDGTDNDYFSLLIVWDLIRNFLATLTPNEQDVSGLTRRIYEARRALGLEAPTIT